MSPMRDLTYVLSSFPVARETFVTGEIAAVADRVERVRVVALTRTDEPDQRPGGIPERVGVDWFPRLGESRWASGLARAAATRRLPLGHARRLPSPAGFRAGVGDLYRASRAAAFAGLGPSGLAGTHVHAHFATRGAMAARALATALGRPYSVTVHAYDLYMDNPFLACVVEDAALVVAISEHGRESLLARFALAADRIRVIHVGVPTDALGAQAAELHPRPTTDGPVRLVSAGRLVAKKGFGTLIEAVAILRARRRDVVLEIVGDGPLRPELDAAVRRQGLGEVVTLAGQVSPEAARAQIGQADAFVLACTQGADGDLDGIPVVLMEAMALGVPVISTRLAGIPELIYHGRTGRLASAEDPAGLADEIEVTLTMPPDRRAEQTADARRFVAAQFDQARNAQRLIDAIDDLASAQPSTSSAIRRR